MPSCNANHNDKWDAFPPDRKNWKNPDIRVDYYPFESYPGELGDEVPIPGKLNNLYANIET